MIGVFEALEETVDVSEVRKLCVFVLHAARKDVGDGAFEVELKAELSVDPPKDRVDFVAAPDLLEVLELLQLESSNPLEELFRMGQLFLDIYKGILMVEDILILGISEISEHVFGVARYFFEVEKLIETKFLNEPLFFLILSALHLDLVVVVDYVFVWFLFLEGFGVVRMRKHVPRDWDPILDRVSDPQGERVGVVI